MLASYDEIRAAPGLPDSMRMRASSHVPQAALVNQHPDID
jgi:hypothetical protein